MKIQSIRGMNDLHTDDSHLWNFIEKTSREVFHSFGYSEIRTPILESTELFKRSVGDTTDIVEKEMYTFEDRNGDKLSLRPEGTAAVVRAYLENSLMQDNPIQKFYYIGPMFRHERPQKGRYRQFFQIGVEVFGPKGPLADLEVLHLQHHLLAKLGIKDVMLHLSSLGSDACRPAYEEKLRAELEKHTADLCEDCLRRKDKNPLRVFDCKVPKCKEIAATLPKLIDNLSGEAATHLAQIEEGLKALNIPYKIDPNIVRGLDYYNLTAFEFVYSGDALGAQSTISGGGRYDGLVKLLGGRDTPAVGFAAGIERIALILEAKKQEYIPKTHLYVVLPDSHGLKTALPLVEKLRAFGARVELDIQEKKMKQQMKRADKVSAEACLIIGEKKYKRRSLY